MSNPYDPWPWLHGHLTYWNISNFLFLGTNGNRNGENDYTTIKPKSENGQVTPTADCEPDGGSSTWEILIVALIFLAAVVSLGVVYLNFPKLEPYV